MFHRYGDAYKCRVIQQTRSCDAACGLYCLSAAIAFFRVKEKLKEGYHVRDNETDRPR